MSDFEQRYRNWHTKISHAKSVVRMFACGGGIALSSDPVVAICVLAAGLIIAEILGVVEEII